MDEFTADFAQRSIGLPERLLAHLETIHGDDINARLANAMTEGHGDLLSSIYRVEQENRRRLEQMTSESLAPTETKQRIKRIQARVQKIRERSNESTSR